MVCNNKKNSVLIGRAGVMSICAFFISTNCIQAQVHAPFVNHQQWILDAEVQYQQHLYSAAAPSAAAYLANCPPKFLNTLAQADHQRGQFAQALSFIALGKIDQSFVEVIHPAYQERLSLARARYYFERKKWNDAIAAYQEAGIANLNNSEIVASKFELAYCHFNYKQFAEAKTILQSLKGVAGKYTASVHYYYGLLAYNEGDYQSARFSFEQIEQHKDFSRVVPYYLAEIEYFEGNKDKALAKARSIIAGQEQSYYHKEANLLAAQCLFEAQKFAAAIPYFEYYYNRVEKIRKQDLYKMGYSYYRNTQWDKAIESFQQLSTVQDNLGQNAMYLLGDCYLKTKDKKGAKNAFGICSQMDYDTTLIEPSLLISGQLAFELGYGTEGAAQLNKLITQYPRSPYKDQAATVLSEQLIRSGNYLEAYQLLHNRASASKDLLQKACYGLAVLQMQNNKWDEAERLLNESIEVAQDADYKSAAHFWLAEILYRNKNYAAALEQCKMFFQYYNAVALAKISANATAQHASLTAGYAALNVQDYSQAKQWFAQSQKQNDGLNPTLLSDAILREADAAFLDKDYTKAIEQYNKIILQNGQDRDYAQFQKSNLLGLMGKSAEQVELLQILITQKNPESKYKYEAHYALGDLHLDANKFEDAINHFQKITEQNAKHLAAKALMKTGFAYQESDNDQKAIETYKKVVLIYPNTEHSSAALDALKNLYVSTNQPNAYVQLLKENRLSPSDNNALDTLFYNSAEAQYIGGKYDKAAAAFSGYLSQYPRGAFYLKANFYKAESHLQLKQLDSALIAYSAVVEEPWSDFIELSALKAATIAQNKMDYAGAARYYGLLRNNAVRKENLRLAYKGLMLTAKQQKNLSLASRYADTVMQIPEIDEETKSEALMVRANDLQEQKKYDEAKLQYELLLSVKTIELSAEAHYRLAQILLLQNKLAEAEQAATKSIKETNGSLYWNTKSYLLIAEVFEAQKDYFNAKATLQSVVKNIKNEELKKEASVQLERVKLAEKQKSKLSEG